MRGPSDKLTPGMHARLSTTPRALRPAPATCDLHLHLHILTSTCSLNEFLREPIARSLHDKVRRCRFSPATAGQPRKRVVVGDLSLSRSICRSLCRSVRNASSIHRVQLQVSSSCSAHSCRIAYTIYACTICRRIIERADDWGGGGRTSRYCMYMDQVHASSCEEQALLGIYVR